jgi:hypothetical protein
MLPLLYLSQNSNSRNIMEQDQDSRKPTWGNVTFSNSTSNTILHCSCGLLFQDCKKLTTLAGKQHIQDGWIHCNSITISPYVLQKTWCFSLKEARFDGEDLRSAEGRYVDINRKSKVR